HPHDEYAYAESDPLITAASILNPVGVGLEYAIYRPIHWLVSLNATTELIFGHPPHGPEERRTIECTPIEMLSCTGAAMAVPVAPTMGWAKSSAQTSSTSMSASA